MTFTCMYTEIKMMAYDTANIASFTVEDGENLIFLVASDVGVKILTL